MSVPPPLKSAVEILKRIRPDLAGTENTLDPVLNLNGMYSRVPQFANGDSGARFGRLLTFDKG